MDAEQKQLISVLQGDGTYINRILSRESSAGQSSRIYYRKPEGVPFNWEMQPGTPKNRPEEEAIPPLSPPPQVQNLGLPKPCIDHLTERPDHSKVWFWKKIKTIHKDKKLQAQTSEGAGTGTDGVDHRNEEIVQHKDQSDGEFLDSSNNSFSTSSSSSSSSNSHAVESSGDSRMPLDGSFCCTPWNISTILDEGNRKVYYCRVHKTAFAVENDGSLVGKILPRVSSVGQSCRSLYRSSDGIPFKWEMQPGTPKDPPENELIPPPSPPPAMQGLGLPLPKPNTAEETEKTWSSKMLRIWFWITNKKTQETEKVGEINCDRLDDATEFYYSDDQNSAGTGSISRSSSSSSISVSKPNGVMKLSKFRRDFLGGHFCFKPWNI